MLRAAVLTFAGIIALAGLWLLLRGVTGPGLYALGMGCVIILGVLFERWRYRPAEPPPGDTWQNTGEQFVDPASGRHMDVYYHPGSGERRYVSRDT